jgi:catechol 2,3-dioxygenase-like lactoylglutathione lyase family enzyme
VRLPAHPVWFWLLLGAPFLIWLVLWAIARSGKVSLKPLKPWLLGGSLLFGPTYFFLDLESDHKVLRLASGVVFWTCWLALLSINNWFRFETLRAPGAKWYIPWNAVEFSIPSSVRIVVRDVSAVSPWYVEKLGLRKLAEKPGGESGAAIYKFKQDGNSVVLSTSRNWETHKTAILFSKKIGRIKDVLAARGIEVGTIEHDRQGIRYFEIHDPEGNVIEVVEER